MTQLRNANTPTAQRSLLADGTPANDGAYAAHHHPAHTSLDAPVNARLASLQANGFVVAASRNSKNPERNARGRKLGATDERALWWSRAAATAEHRPDGATAPKMGITADGKRIARRTYRGANNQALRMPSAAAIHRFASQNAPRPFDIPVEFTDPNGNSVQSWVRATCTDGAWDVLPMDSTSPHAQAASEAIAAIMESRTPTLAMREAGDLLALHRERSRTRAQRRGASPSSGSVPGTGGAFAELAYDHEAGVLVMKNAGRVEGKQVPLNVARQLLASNTAGESPVRFYQRAIRPARSVDYRQCEACTHYIPVRSEHDCPREVQAARTIGVQSEAEHMMDQMWRELASDFVRSGL